MGGVNALLTERLKKKSGTPHKTAELAKQSASGHLTGFTGIFGVSELSSQEKYVLQNLLEQHAKNLGKVEEDLNALIAITSEVKAINNQAALLHGERIKKAQKILTEYRDGAFTGWLIATYGNRQTPYNFLQYFEFYEALPKTLHPQIELMPRQAIYTLASREGNLALKKEIVEQYKGETKDELLRIIRDTFPLGERDRRRRNHGEAAIQHLKRACSILSERRTRLTKLQRENIEELIDSLKTLIEKI